MPNDDLISKLTPEDRAHIYAQEASRLSSERSATRRIHTGYLIAIATLVVLGSIAMFALHHRYDERGRFGSSDRPGYMRMMQRGEDDRGTDNMLRRGPGEKSMHGEQGDDERQNGRMNRLNPAAPQFDRMQPGLEPLPSMNPTPPSA